MGDREFGHGGYPQYGDQIHQTAAPNSVVIGKQEFHSGGDRAAGDLRLLLAELRQAGIVDDRGVVQPGADLVTEVGRRRWRFESLFTAVLNGAGPALQQAAGSAAARLIVNAVQSLG